MGFQHMTPERRSALGTRGGLRNKQRRLAEDPDYFAKIGLKGGMKHDIEHLRRIGKIKKGEGKKGGAA